MLQIEALSSKFKANTSQQDTGTNVLTKFKTNPVKPI